MTTCLITRAQPGAHVTEALLQAAGHRAICVPAAVIVPTHVSIDVSGVQALLMTSAAAARNIEVNPALGSLPVYAVGNATAEAAVAAGFTNVISAGGDGANLAVLAADRMKTDAGALLHVRGTEVAGDVTSMLAACGFETRFTEVYATQDHPDFADHIARYINMEAGIVLFHSPAGARRFAHALGDKNDRLGQWCGVGLSLACLAPVEKMGFKHLTSAKQPDENALMEAVFSHAMHSSP